MKPTYWAKAKRDLKKSDKVLKTLIEKYKGETIESRGNAFETLARSIVGQQISVKAAQSVWQKVLKRCRKVSPKKVLSLSVTDLRACGLSERKVQYLKDLALHFSSKKIVPHHWYLLSDEQIIEELIAVKGIGRWTAEMFLMFHLLRPDVFPAADLGMQKAISLQYKVPYPMSKKQLERFRKKYSPWATVAVWYLWRSLDPIPVEY